MSKMNDYLKHQKAINELTQNHGEEMIQELFERLFSSTSALDVVFIYGYTPGFNDGDPCYHRQYVEVGSDEVNERIEEYLDILDEDESYNDNLSSDEADEIVSSIDELSDLFEQIYDTDFYVIARRAEDGSIEIHIGDYDCGY